jgi:hypothetical protein
MGKARILNDDSRLDELQNYRTKSIVTTLI